MRQTLTSATPASIDAEGGAAPSGPVNMGAGSLAQLLALGDLVQREGACSLPGVSIKYDTFMPVMWAAVQAGFVRQSDAVFVAEGLRYGFNLGVNVQSLQGHRWFRNYGTAVQARSSVTEAIDVRGHVRQDNVSRRVDDGAVRARPAHLGEHVHLSHGGGGQEAGWHDAPY